MAPKKTETGKECTLERQYQQGEKFKNVAFFLRALSNSWAAKGIREPKSLQDIGVRGQGRASKRGKILYRRESQKDMSSKPAHKLFPYSWLTIRTIHVHGRPQWA